LSRRDDDRGTTLVEILIALAVLGIVFITVLGGMGVTTIASDVHRKQANAHAILLSAVERLKSSTEVAYDFDCNADFSNYLAEIRKVPRPAPAITWPASTITIPSVQFWNGTTFDATCHDVMPILRLQLITVAVTSADGKVTEKLDVIKRGT